MIQLRNYSHYTPWESVLKIDDIINSALENGHKHVGLTDGCLNGAINFYLKCKKNGLNPIIGQEFYYTTELGKQKIWELYKITLIAKNYRGYQNLLKLSTIANLENFYYVPRIDYKNIEQYHEDLYCIVDDHITKNLTDQSKIWDELEELADIFCNRLFYQVQPLSSHYQINKFIEANITNDRIIVANGNRYKTKQDHKLHEICLTIQANFLNRKRKSLGSDDYYIHKDNEMRGNLSNLNDLDKYIKNTTELAESINLEIPTDVKLPTFEGMNEEAAFQAIKEMAEFDLVLSKKVPKGKINQYKSRLEYELNIIKDLDFSNYFLIVSDIVRQAKKMGIEVGGGRGSACGSVLGWILGIHEIDPIKYGLHFERFLNPERISMPDIDIDFEDRDPIIEYVSEKYGSNRVAQICTFSTLRLKAAIKDVSKAFDKEYSTTNSLSQIIPEKYSDISQVTNSSKYKEFIKENPDFEEIFEISVKLQGQFRQNSTHASAVIITPDDITNYTPLQRVKKSVVTQYDMYSLENIGLLKIDFLGLTTLKVIRSTIDLAKADRKEIKKFNDGETFRMISKGDTVGVFQIEDGQMMGMAQKMKVNNLEDISDLIAMCRPAVMAGGLHTTYMHNKNRPDDYRIIHESLKDIFDETYGVPLYQEQLMNMARTLGNLTMSEADILRKAASKKQYHLLKDLKVKFISGCLENNLSENDANDIWKIAFENVAEYLFNKSHSVAYGVISYMTAYLKRHYPTYFFCCLLSSFQDQAKKEQFTTYLEDTLKHKIKVNKPNINKSDYVCTVIGNEILLSLTCIKHIGESFATKIIESRATKGPFKDINDFCLRIAPSASQLESLLKAGAFHDSHKYLGNEEKIVEYNKRMSKETDKFSNGLLGIELEKEKLELTRFNYSKERLNGFLYDAIGYTEKEEFKVGQIYTVKSYIKDMRAWTTKTTSKEMAEIIVEACPGYKMLVFPYKYKKFKEILEKDEELTIAFKLLEEGKLALESIK